MSTSWQDPARPPCGQKSCARAGRFAHVSLAAAYVSLVCVLLTPYRLLFGALLVLSATGAVAAAGRLCPHQEDGDDFMAIVEAVRECRCCSPEDRGPCTCTRECGSIRCTTGFPRQPARVLYLDRLRHRRVRS